ncbi:MAG TPA: hypothetical protein VMH41_02980 [Mycobacteriales bacterium]|nr:hypothetical protein [Mycobacteriales bacterium]
MTAAKAATAATATPRLARARLRLKVLGCLATKAVTASVIGKAHQGNIPAVVAAIWASAEDAAAHRRDSTSTAIAVLGDAGGR